MELFYHLRLAWRNRRYTYSMNEPADLTRDRSNPRIKSAIAELQRIIQQRYPMATFEVTRGDDPEGVYLFATVDVDDTDEVIDLFVDRLLLMQLDEGLPLYVVPLRSAERVAASMQSNLSSRAGFIAGALLSS